MISSSPMRAALAVAFLIAVVDSVSAKVVHIDIKKNLFLPKSIAAEVGDTIEWMNEDAVGHTATAKDKSWDVILAPHAMGTMVITTPGMIYYFCRFHPNMTARLEVGAR